MSRICLEDTVRHTCKRLVYGKPLIEQPVVRYKLANMAYFLSVSLSHNQTYDRIATSVAGIPDLPKQSALP